jgi:hypothetical protein
MEQMAPELQKDDNERKMYRRSLIPEHSALHDLVQHVIAQSSLRSTEAALTRQHGYKGAGQNHPLQPTPDGAAGEMKL